MNCYTPDGGRLPASANLPGHAPEAKGRVAPVLSLSAQTHFPGLINDKKGNEDERIVEYSSELANRKER